MKIICTGALGFIGSHTVERLLEVGHEVFGFDRFRAEKMENLSQVKYHPRFRITHGDLHKFSIRSTVKHVEPEAIIHLAQQGTQSVAYNAIKYKVRRFVFASSSGVYGNPSVFPIRETSQTNPITPNGATKLAEEALLKSLVKHRWTEVVCLRLFNVYGSREAHKENRAGIVTKFQEAVKLGQPATIAGDGSQTRDFIHVSDVAEAFRLAAILPMARRFEVFNVGTGIETSISDLWARLSVLPPTLTTSPSNDVPRSVADTTWAEGLLRFKSKVKLEDGLKLT